ncbi:MAG: hypothetical protein V7603_4040, partial [Micromonosporaceae bacterium]
AKITAQFGPPVITQRFGPRRLLLIYDHNILTDLPSS